ncbi:hypothetical protein [Paraburkholderia phenazinium]|uniref:hypothetical protein n=1 Tax=Paraburkholderia phenazinium TaxID=60549 RepID=UPI00158A6469|nr:hypothetical protein [Paraburkholderia phenazinium]
MANSALRYHEVAFYHSLEIAPFALAICAFRARSRRWLRFMAFGVNALCSLIFVVGTAELLGAFQAPSAAALSALITLPCVANACLTWPWMSAADDQLVG